MPIVDPQNPDLASARIDDARRVRRSSPTAGTSEESAAELPPDVATITPYRDGPLLVRGPFRLQDMHGREIEVGREVVALCRCGKSRIRPFCDGSHKFVRFKAPSGPEHERRPLED